MIEKNYDEKGNASHYGENRINAIVKYERVYGTIAVMHFCEISADKYRERIGKKPGQSLQQEALKIQWYEKAAKFYLDRIGTIEEIIVHPTAKNRLPWEEKETQS